MSVLEYRIPNNGLKMAGKWTCDVVVFEKDFDWTEDKQTPVLKCNMYRYKSDYEAHQKDGNSEIPNLHRSILIQDGIETDNIHSLISKAITATTLETTNGESLNFTEATPLL